MVLKKVGMLSCGKIMGVTYGAMGLIAGAIFTVVSLLGAAIDTASGESTQAIVGLLFGVGVIIILPVFYGVAGFFGGMITAGIYNVVAALVGGIELQLE